MSTSPSVSNVESHSGPLKILITGASGMIGHALLAEAAERGHAATPVLRPARGERSSEPPAPHSAILWDPDAAHPFADLERLEGFDAVIHLAGANLSAHRWTDAYKKQIVESRTQTTSGLALVLARLQKPPRVLISASATGYYGSRGDEVLTETSVRGTGFLSDVCDAWEKATAPASAAGIRVAHMRFGVVLSPYGGALAQMLPIFKAGLGGRLGNGQMWQSWITLRDLLRAIFWVIDHDSLAGAVNAVAPEPVRNTEFTHALGHALGHALRRPTVFPVPKFALHLLFGQMADEALLGSTRAIPKKLYESGFEFEHGQIGPALQAILRR